MIDYNAIHDNPQTCFEQLLTDTSPAKYLYGPYIVMNSDLSMYKLTWGHPILKMFLDIAMLIKYMNNKYTHANLKTLIINYLTVNRSFESNCWQAKTTCDAYQQILSSIKDYQYENKLLESAMTSYAPIIDYSGMCKMPMATNENTETTDKSLPSQSNLTSIPNTNDLDELLKKYLFSIVAAGGEGITPFNDSDLFKLYNMKDSRDDYTNTCTYYIKAYLVNRYQNSDGTKMLDTLKASSKAQMNIAEEKFNTEYLVSLFSNIATEADNNQDMSSHLEYENDKENEKAMNMANLNDTDTAELEKKYNIYTLTNYMYNARRYMHNAYTNAFFINSNKELQDYTYLEDNILVVEVDNEYLCSPVIDLADDYKIKLIRVNRDDVISIIPLK